MFHKSLLRPTDIIYLSLITYIIISENRDATQVGKDTYSKMHLGTTASSSYSFGLGDKLAILMS